ncbi:hypothetical protein [Serratia rubidaea]|uniref:hypothetical protein n=1 Tax=Serratia rubidaea TaxID=61652 RepID=UPI002349B70A|nr:hypothetical protein [Serratia rubidaea]MDC6111867.1 hypothetical protein [Serratia rubidaea]
MTFPSPLMGFSPESDTPYDDVGNIDHLNSPAVTAIPPVSDNPDTDDRFFRFPSTHSLIYLFAMMADR